MNAPRTDLSALKNPGPREATMPDLKIDMFSLRGFELAQRIARAFSMSDAVPVQFRSHTLKKNGDGTEVWVENPSALGNCIVAIETAQAVGTSITSVMQNANVIEGRLTWSGKYVIAAINASKRFTPLRFHMVNKGKIKAKYKEKGSWNKERKRYDMIEHEVEIENIECIAWALPYGAQFPAGVATLDQARNAGLPVVEGAQVSIKMAVEEGWYAKPGSKWQTEMKFLMLQYRAGSFFGNIHAPDIVMGMGRTAEEILDTIEVHPQPDGTYAANLDELRGANSGSKPLPADSNVVDVTTEAGESGESQSPGTGNSEQTVDLAGATAAAGDALDQMATDVMTYAQVADAIQKAKNIDTLDEAADLIKHVADADQQGELRVMYDQRKDQLDQAATKRQQRAGGMKVD